MYNSYNRLSWLYYIKFESFQIWWDWYSTVYVSVCEWFFVFEKNMSSTVVIFSVCLLGHAVQIFYILTDLSPTIIMDLSVFTYYSFNLFVIILSAVAFCILGLCINLFS